MALSYTPSSAGSTGNPPMAVASLAGPISTDRSNALQAGRIYLHSSTMDITDFAGTLNSVSDASVLGIKGGDVLIMVSATAGSTTPKLQLGVFVTSASATGAAISSNVLSSTQV